MIILAAGSMPKEKQTMQREKIYCDIMRLAWIFWDPFLSAASKVFSPEKPTENYGRYNYSELH
jgi:hypothetical protein